MIPLWAPGQWAEEVVGWGSLTADSGLRADLLSS